MQTASTCVEATVGPVGRLKRTPAHFHKECFKAFMEASQQKQVTEEHLKLNK